MTIGYAVTGSKAYATDVTVPASDSYTTAGAESKVLQASQVSLLCKVVSTDAGDSDLVAFHFIAHGEGVGYPTIADWVVNVPTAGNTTATKGVTVNVEPYTHMRVLKIVNGNANDVTANVEVSFTK